MINNDLYNARYPRFTNKEDWEYIICCDEVCEEKNEYLKDLE